MMMMVTRMTKITTAISALALLVSVSASQANEIPPEQLASLGWALSANSGSVDASGGTSSPSAIDVYAGCPATPAVPTDPNSKVWHFDFGAGHSQSYYATNPPPAGHYAGDATYPYDNPNAITQVITGWTKPLAALAAWNHSGSIHSDYSATGTVTVTVSAPGSISFGATMLDGAGRRFILQSHTFAAAGSANLALVAQAPGTASNDPVGTTFTGETGFNVEVGAKPSASGTNVLFFDPLPSWVAVNQWVTDKTTSGVISNDIITAVNHTTGAVTLATNIGGAGVASGDEIQFTGTGVTPDSVTLISDMAGGADFRTVDATHSKLWPGDVVELDGTTQFPATVYGGTENINVVNVDAAGNRDYVWFVGNGTNRPHLSGLSIGQASNVIVQGVDVDHTSPLNQYSGSSPLSNGVTFSRVATPSDTFTVNGEVWTYTTGSTDIASHLIAAGTTATNTAANTALALIAAAAAGDTAAQGWATYSSNGAGLTLRKTGWTGTSLPSFSTSIVQTNTEAGISVAQPLPTSAAAAAVHISGSPPAPAYAVYLEDVYVDAGGTTGVRKQLDDYPMTGSLGISPDTGQLVPADVGGPWNSVDWVYNTRDGFGITGSVQNPIINADDPLAGAQCITLQDTWVKHGNVSYAWSDTKDLLIENAISDYAGSDNYVNANSNSVSLLNAAVRNTVDNGAGAHPDGWQGQSTLSWTGENGWHDLLFDRFSVYPAEDTVLSSRTYNDFNGVSRPLAGVPTGIQGTITAYNNVTVTNSVIFSHNGPNLSFGSGHNITIANNTVMWDGSSGPFPQDGKITVNLSQPSGATPPWNITITNNVANTFIRDSGLGKTCNVGITFHHNYVVGTYYSGAQNTGSTFADYCVSDTSGTTVGGSPANGTTTDDGGISYIPVTPLSSIFTQFVPAGNGTPPTNLDATLVTGSPLKGAGVTGFGSTATDFNGTTRASPPSVGAYE